MNIKKECAGIVTVTLGANSPVHIRQINQSIELLKSLELPKVFVIQDVKTKIEIDTFQQQNVVEVIPVDVFDTCQKWYIGLKRAFESGFQRGFIFPGDIEQYEGKDLVENNTLKDKLAHKLAQMILDPADLIIGDYDVPQNHANQKYQLSKNGALQFIKVLLPEEWKKLQNLQITFPRSEYFIITRRLFNDFLSEQYSKWMPWEATIQLLVYAVRNKYKVTRYYLGEIGDNDIHRKYQYEIFNQLFRILYVVACEYMKYLAFQNIAGTLPIDWLSEMKNCFNSFLYYFMDRFVITIDGPTGAGKSTIASLLASKLDFLYIDGGIFFRALTLKGIRDNIDLNNEEELVGLSQRISITLFNNKEGILKKTGVLINDEDVSNELWSPSVSNNVPFVSIHNQLREERKTWVRNLAGNYLITEGRTLGREVFPDAILKFYVDASIEKRAERRHLQLKEKGINRGNDDIMKDIFERDEKDRHGKIDRLEMPRDAIYLDTTDLTIDEVVKILINMILPVLKIWKIQKYE